MRILVKIHRLFLLFLCCAVIVSCNTHHTDDSKDVAEEVNDKKLRTKAAEKDAQYLVDAAAASYDHTRLADIALTNGTGQPIKKLATQLKDFNTRLIVQLNNIAGPKAITLPTAGTEKILKDAGAIIKATDESFNQEWKEKLGSLLQHQVNIFEKASVNVSDSGIREWFKKTLPVVRSQVSLIDSVANNFKP